jgi:hypothetical protein
MEPLQEYAQGFPRFPRDNTKWCPKATLKLFPKQHLGCLEGKENKKPSSSLKTTHIATKSFILATPYIAPPQYNPWLFWKDFFGTTSHATPRQPLVILANLS